MPFRPPKEGEMVKDTHGKDALSSTARQAAETAKSIGEEVSDYARDASPMASKQFGRVQDAAIDAFDETEAAIRRNPLSAIAIALGVGFCLEYLPLGGRPRC